MIQYNDRHGGPYDRGRMDSYYGRPRAPHYYVNGTYDSPRLEEVDMSENELEAYFAGYTWNELHGDKKEWD